MAVLMHSNTKDITDQRFGRLVVLRVSKNRGAQKKQVYWLCQCDCGKKVAYAGGDLRRGEIKSCGCYRRDNGRKTMAAKFLKHGHARGGSPSRTYNIWRSMRQRCLSEGSTAFEYYGGRGIKICKRWDRFENFLADMGEAPPGLTLERKDNNRDYELGNCRWATRYDQIHNRRPQSEWFAPPGPKANFRPTKKQIRNTAAGLTKYWASPEGLRRRGLL